MFEYLMPALVMQSFPFTLLDQTYTGAVSRQIAYGRERGVPWGVSESAYNARDRDQIYQYRAFGVPDLALKRGLSRDLVVAPYATLLALGVEPHQAMRNLAALEAEGALGPYGFRDAVDYTRPQPGSRRAIVGRVHGASHRHGAGGAHQRHHARPVAAPVPRRRPRAVRGADVVRAHSAAVRAAGGADGRARRAAPTRLPGGREAGGALVRHGGHAPAAPHAPRPSAVHRDDHQRRRRVQSVRSTRRHALAGRPDARSGGPVVLPEGRHAVRRRRSAGRAARDGLVGRPPAGGRAGRLVPGHASRPIERPSIGATAISRRGSRSRWCRTTRPKCGGSR